MALVLAMAGNRLDEGQWPCQPWVALLAQAFEAWPS